MAGSTIEELLGALNEAETGTEKVAEDTSLNPKEENMSGLTLMDMFLASHNQEQAQTTVEKTAAENDAVAEQFGVDTAHLFNEILSEELEKHAEKSPTGATMPESNKVEGHNAVDTHNKHIMGIKEQALAKKRIEKMLENPMFNTPAGQTSGQVSEKAGV